MSIPEDRRRQVGKGIPPVHDAQEIVLILLEPFRPTPIKHPHHPEGYSPQLKFGILGLYVRKGDGRHGSPSAMPHQLHPPAVKYLHPLQNLSPYTGVFLQKALMRTHTGFGQNFTFPQQDA